MRLREQGRWTTPAVPALGAAVVGVTVTMLVIFVPGLHFAYRSVLAHLAMENVDASIAAIVAVLFYGRYRRGGASCDLLISAAFGLLSSCGFMLVILPAVSAHPSTVWTSWIPLVVRLFAAGLIALAAANPRRRVSEDSQVGRVALTAGAILLGVIVAGVAARNRLPSPLDPTLSPDASHTPRVVGAPAVLAAQAVHGLLYGFAAVAFTLHAARTRDDLTRWLAAGCVFGAFARVNYFLFPSLYSQWLYTGDFLRTAFYIALGIGAVREVTGYWTLQAETAVFAERRRMARELHDGTVQELGYIRSLAREMQRTAGDGAVAERIVAAAERAIAEARHAIAALTLPLNEPVADAIRRAAGEIADRYDVELRLQVGADGDLESERREAVVRIVREAVSNAARHGRAQSVEVRFTRGCLEIHDDGRGFVVAGSADRGFGLVSMRERAEAVGGQLQVTSRPGSGTTVRMVWG